MKTVEIKELKAICFRDSFNALGIKTSVWYSEQSDIKAELVLLNGAYPMISLEREGHLGVLKNLADAFWIRFIAVDGKDYTMDGETAQVTQSKPVTKKKVTKKKVTKSKA